MAINWPKSKAIDELIRLMPSDPNKFIGSRFAPIRNAYAQQVEYEEISSPVGMTQANSLDADPPLVSAQQRVKKLFQPAYFKEMDRISESDMLTLQALGGTEYQVLAMQDQIAQRMSNLNHRLEVRIEWMRWQALINGSVTINNNGVVQTATYGIPAAQLDRRVAVVWSNTAASTPVVDLMGWMSNFTGSGYNMGAVVMNLFTASLLCQSTQVLGSYAGASINEKLTPGALPKYFPVLFPGSALFIYNEGYTDETSGVFTPFISNNKVVMLGDAPAGEIIDVVSTPYVDNNSGMSTRPGKFGFLVDHTKDENPHVNLVAGFYGLPRVKRTAAIQVADVSKT